MHVIQNLTTIAITVMAASWGLYCGLLGSIAGASGWLWVLFLLWHIIWLERMHDIECDAAEERIEDYRAFIRQTRKFIEELAAK